MTKNIIILLIRTTKKIGLKDSNMQYMFYYQSYQEH